MIRPAFWRLSILPGMAPGALVGVDQAIALPGGLVHIRRGVSGFGDKNRILRVGNSCSRYLERWQPVRSASPFAVIPAELTRAVVAICRFVERIGGLTLGLIGARDKFTRRYRNHLRRGEFLRGAGASRQAPHHGSGNYEVAKRGAAVGG